MTSLRIAATALITALSLAACGSETTETAEAGEGANGAIAEVETYRFGTFFDGDEFSEDRVVATGSGLEYVVLESGDAEGASPRATDCVTVDYEGRIAATGERFDGTLDGGQPATFPVGGLIAGWTEALQIMRPGDDWVLRIPADLAYGDNPRPGGAIQPGDDLAFRLLMRDVRPMPSLTPEQWDELPDWTGDDEAIQTTESGLRYVVLDAEAEPGAQPSTNDRVVVHYEGRFAGSGEIFDASWRQCRPAMFGVTQVIPGWTEMLQLMGEGQEVVVFIPSDLAYGRRGKGPIGPDEDLVFYMKLEDVLSVE